MDTHVNSRNREPNRERRSFLNWLMGTSVVALAAAALYPVLRYINPPRIPEAVRSQVLAGKISEMKEKKWKIFPFGQEPGILIKVGPGEFRALSASCTHLDCTVQFDGETKRIWCPCHNGWYDLEGRNIAGPPPRPLTPFKVRIEDDDIFVSKA